MTDITLEELRHFVNYDPETGRMTWAVNDPSRRKFLGKDVGWMHDKGGKRFYLRTQIMDKYLYVHRLCFFHYHGYMPRVVDHLNGNTTDNRICNLRGTTQSGNMLNRKVAKSSITGVSGVVYRKSRSKPYAARIGYKGKFYHIGSYKTFKEACEARRKEEVRLGFINRDLDLPKS